MEPILWWGIKGAMVVVRMKVTIMIWGVSVRESQGYGWSRGDA